MAASTSPFAIPTMTVDAKNISKLVEKTVSSAPPMWPAGREAEDRAHPEHVAERPADEDRQPEAPERRAQNPADLDVVEGEEALDVAHDVAANGERHGRGDERNAAGEEEALSVHGVTIIYEHLHLKSALAPAMLLTFLLGLTLSLPAQQREGSDASLGVPLQPLAQQVRRLESALRYLGQPLPAADHLAINDAVALADETAAAARLQAVLDRHVLATVRINPESRVSVEPGAAKPDSCRAERACS